MSEPAFRRIATAYGAGLLSVVSSLLTNVWLLGAVTREVDKSTLGYALLIGSSAAYLGLLQLSLDLAAGLRIAGALAKQDQESAARIYRQVARINQVLAAGILAATAAAAASVRAFAPDTDHATLFAGLVGLAGTGQVVQCLARPVIAGLTGAQRVATISLVRVGATVGATMFAYGLLKLGIGVYCLPIAELTSQVLVWVILSQVFRGACPWATLGVSDWTDKLGDLVRYGAVVSLTSAVNYACLNCDVFLLLLADPYSSVLAENYAWMRFPQLFYSMNWMLFGAASPTVAAAFAGDTAEGVRVFRRVCHAVVGIAAAGILALGVWLSPVVHVWLGGLYDLPDGPGVAAAMAAGVGAKNILSGFALAYYASNAVRPVTLAHAVQLGCKVALGCVLIPRFTILGLAVADAVAALVAAALLGRRLVRDGYGTSRSTIGAAAACGVAAGAAAVLGQSTAGLDWSATVIGIVLSALVLGSVLYVWLAGFGAFPRRSKPATGAGG